MGIRIIVWWLQQLVQSIIAALSDSFFLSDDGPVDTEWMECSSIAGVQWQNLSLL